ncbi:MAG: biotin/lipoate A/B protein ligase family protein [Mariniblastus sp.]
MKQLQLTLESSAENLAIDEALLEMADSCDDHPEVFRIWEPIKPMVVLGRSSPIEQESNLDYCRQHNVDVLRRASGGQAIVTGPGCLMYAALLDYRKRPELRMLEQAHQFVMGKMQRAIEGLGISVQMQGTSDLTYESRKFSGNSLRCKRNWLIYHGTMLCDFDLDLIANCLGKPIREPSYREGRSHREFLIQLPTSCDKLAKAMIKEWQAEEPHSNWPVELTQKLVRERYTNDQWTFKVR